jgi:hypothetical protein
MSTSLISLERSWRTSGMPWPRRASQGMTRIKIAGSRRVLLKPVGGRERYFYLGSRISVKSV